MARREVAQGAGTRTPLGEAGVATAGPDGTSIVRVGGECIRVGPWRAGERVALLAPVPEGRTPGPATVRKALDVAAHHGFAEAVTAALTRTEACGFAASGFEVRERLHLLSHDLHGLAATGHRGAPWLRRSGRADRAGVLDVDHRAFDRFWRLDDTGLDDAIGATPNVRFRVAVHGDAVLGYAVTGRALRRGYVQRLAVHPEHRHQGLGRSLVLDGLRWLRRHRATVALVNTQEANEPAMVLYESLGFHRRPEGLAVMATTLPAREGKPSWPR